MMKNKTSALRSDAFELTESPTPVHAVHLQAQKTVVETSGSAATRVRTLDIVGEVKVTLDIRLGSAVIPIGELMSLGEGAVIELDRHLGEPVDVLLNSHTIGRAEIVAVGDHFGIRMTEIPHTNHDNV
jgi:flagellar motor switch protein FliN